MGNPIEAEELYGKVEAALRETRLDMASRNKLLHEALLFAPWKERKTRDRPSATCFSEWTTFAKSTG